MIYTLRTTVGRENAVINTLTNKIENIGSDIRALLYPAELKGYIFVEGDLSAIEKLIQGVPHVRGLIRKEVMLQQLKQFLETKKVEIKINRGDVIEIVGGPFKGEKGKVTRIDEAKEEITVELLEAAVPIPITISTDSVRIVERSEEKKG